MKKITALLIAGAAMGMLSGCKGLVLGGVGQVYIDELFNGYKISGRDTIKGVDVDLCYNGGSYVYGRGTEYFEGTFYVDDTDVVFRDATDGGSYRLNTDGEIQEGLTYYFTGISDNIVVESISTSSSVSDCRSAATGLKRTASSLHLGNSARQSDAQENQVSP
jgi:hypothetical protein